MSRFLGPIHYWLFNKIELYEDLEANIVDGMKKKYGEQVEQIAREKEKQFGEPVYGKELEEIIDQGNIHGWLQDKIRRAETRQAAIIAAILKQQDNQALETLKEIYAEHGKDCGIDAAREKQVGNAPEIYKALNDYLLDGMPCDNVNRLKVQEPEQVVWEHTQCLHISYWQEAQADSAVLYELRKIWIENFVTHANSEYSYQYSHENNLFKHAIVKG